MANIKELKRVIDDSGMTIVAISKKSGIARGTIYNRLNGIGDFTTAEIVGLTDALRLSKKQRDYIFLS